MVNAMAPVNEQDSYVLRNLVRVAKDSDIPPGVMQWYEYIRRLKHPVQAGPLSLTELLLAVLLNQIGLCPPQRGENQAEPQAEPQAPKPQTPPPGVSLPVPVLLFVEGHEYVIERDGQLLRAQYKCHGKDGKLRFISVVDDSVFYEVEQGQVRQAS